MKIDLLCSDPNHPVNAWLDRWIERRKHSHEISLFRSKTQLSGGDVLFLISCTEIIGRHDRDRYAHALVVHASDLPKGRGWSPQIWAILEGASELTLSVLNAEDKVDSGDIWAKLKIAIPPHADHAEINAAIFTAELNLMDTAIRLVAEGKHPVPQNPTGASYYSKRTPADSEIDASKTIQEQFDILRVSDPERYPAFFQLHGYKYAITLKKVSRHD